MIAFWSSTFSTALLRSSGRKSTKLLRSSTAAPAAMSARWRMADLSSPCSGQYEAPIAALMATLKPEKIWGSSRQIDEPAQEGLQDLALARGQDEDELALVGVEEPIARLEETLDPAAGLVEDPLGDAGLESLADGREVIAQLDDEEAEALAVAPGLEVLDDLARARGRGDSAWAGPSGAGGKACARAGPPSGRAPRCLGGAGPIRLTWLFRALRCLSRCFAPMRAVQPSPSRRYSTITFGVLGGKNPLWREK